MHIRANLKLLYLFLALCLVLAALPAYAQDATAELTLEATNTSEPVATWTPDAEGEGEAAAETTAGATDEAAAADTEPTAAATPETVTEAEPQAATGLSTLVLLIGVGAVLAVGGVIIMRERARIG